MHAGASGRTTIVKPWLAIGIVGMGTLIAPLDTAVNVAFPAITDAFGIPVRDIQWIITMFGLAQVSLTLVFGKLGDRYGHRKVFMLGLAISVVALVLCASATSYTMLVVMRVLQGVGAGLVMACGPALVTFILLPEQRRQALAFYTMMMAIGMCLGPLAGGLLVQLAGWPAVYWARVPVALLALVLVWRLQHLEQNDALQAARQAAREMPFDRAGAVALVAVLGLVVFVIVQVRDPFAGYGAVLVAAIACVSAFRLLVRAAASAANPIIDLRHFAAPRFRHLQLAAVFIQVATFSLFLLMPYRFAVWPGVSVIEAGVVLAFFPAGSVLAGMAGAALSARVSSMRLVVTGMLLAALGLLACAVLSWQQWLWPTAGAMLLTGFGLGAFQVGHLDATVSAMTVGDRGVAGSLVSVERVLGFALSANLVMWLHDVMRDDGNAPLDYAHTLAAVGMALLAAAVLFVWRHWHGSISGRLQSEQRCQ